MRVIITGGTGLIGRALAADLAGEGHEVIALSRNPERAAGMPPGVRVERWDGRTADGWGRSVEGAWGVVNLAGESLAAGRWTAERKLSIRESRVNAGRAVVEAVEAAKEKPRSLVQASAVGYYAPGDDVVTEDSPPGEGFLAEVTAEWEDSTARVEGPGVRRAVIRSGVVLSAEGGALPRLLLPFRMFAGGPLGSGRQPFPWIHISDEVAAIRFLLENEEARGPFNLSAPNPPTNAEFGHALGRVMKRPSFIPTPAFALRLLFGEMGSVLLEGQHAVPRRLVEMGFRFRFTDAETALTDLLHRRQPRFLETAR